MEGLKLTLLTKEQFRFPRSKKVRIRKKWAKNPENWRPLKPKRVTHYVRSQVVEGAGMNFDCTQERSCTLCEKRVPRTYSTTVRDYETGQPITMRIPETVMHQLRKMCGGSDVNFVVTREPKGFGYDVRRVR